MEGKMKSLLAFAIVIALMAVLAIIRLSLLIQLLVILLHGVVIWIAAMGLLALLFAITNKFGMWE